MTVQSNRGDDLLKRPPLTREPGCLTGDLWPNTGAEATHAGGRMGEDEVPGLGRVSRAGNGAAHGGADAAVETAMQVWAGVYDALGALHAEQLGYDGLWLSSLGLSVGRLGLPDAGYLEPETVLAAIREISRVATIPLVIDIENGYGLPGSDLAEVASSFFAAGSHALCIEDTVGAKRNSLWHGFHRDLSDVDEIVDRLTRLVTVAHSQGGAIVARTEALVEGHSVEEASHRVRRYASAGCSAVVVHFRTDPGAAMEVARRTRGAAKLVVIPTAAPSLTFADLAAAGFGVYVAANVALRAASAATRQALESVLLAKHQAHAVERAASLAELDALVRTEALVGGASQ